jgi:multidrug resistance efflux pump
MAPTAPVSSDAVTMPQRPDAARPTVTHLSDRRQAAHDGSPPPPAAMPAEGTPGAAGAHLIRIEGELRACASHEALCQHLANEPVALLPFGQALVFEADARQGFIAWRQRKARAASHPHVRWRTVAVSGLAAANRDAPATRWYENMAAQAALHSLRTDAIYLFELPTHADPADPCTGDTALHHLMWVPVAEAGQPVRFGWLLARETPWEPAHEKLAARLAEAYAHGFSALEGRTRPPPTGRGRRLAAVAALAAVLLALVLVQVPLTTLAPVEVTPQQPFVVAAPMPGVVERILVAPGAQVVEGMPLVQLTDTSLRSDADVASQKLAVAGAKMLRLQQAAVDDDTAKRELAIARSETGVARAERDYAEAVLDRSVIRARQAGVALYGDPRDWAGRPVAVGEAIMRVADPQRVEYRIKVPVADAVNVRENARVKVFLDAAPLAPLEARVVRAAYKAEADAAGVSSYTVLARGKDAQGAPARLGLRGTARVYGEPVSLMYYLLRRPLTAARQWTGL